jgi:uncharacterized protein (TIGR02145 family)
MQKLLTLFTFQFLLFTFQFAHAQKEVKIGTQVWMVENLNVEKFRNGDSIPEAKTDEEWEKSGDEKKPVWCYYDNDPKNGDKYGKLYNWYAVNDPRGLAPKGWHVPSDEEWTLLADYLGGKEQAGDKIKSKTGWNKDGNGTNSSGFSGLPSGFRNSIGMFDYIGEHGYWWSSTEANTANAWNRSPRYNTGFFSKNFNYKSNGFSVRCLRD